MSKLILSIAVMTTVTASAMAQSADKPVIRHIAPAADKSLVMAVSDNGLWAVARTSGDDGNYFDPRLIDVANGKVIDLFEGTSVIGEATDATDDGKIVVGSYLDKPALYHTDSKKWDNLPIPQNRQFNYGKVSAITPDGKVAVGYAYVTVGENSFVEIPLVWDLSGSAPALVTLTDLPDVDLNGDPASMVRLTELSADGRYVSGIVDFSYPMTSWSFIYDLKEMSWKPLGFKKEDGLIVPDGQGLLIEELRFSPDMSHVAASIYTDEGGEIGYYDMATGKVTVIPGSTGKMLSHVDNNGVVYASAPSSPLRDWSFYLDGYWYDWKDALKQLWGIDWQYDVTKDDYGLSGTFLRASTDGLRLLSADYAGLWGGVYSITLPEPLGELAEDLDPLYNHAAFPAEGSSFSSMRNLTVYFDRDIEVVGSRDCVKLLDENGQEVKSSISVALEASQTRNLLVTFRNAEMESGKTYTVVIPAGTVQVKGDPKHPNKEIRLQYKGRANTPVKAVKVSPESGTAMPRLNMTTNPVTVSFDAALSVLEGGSIGLYRVTGGEDEFLYSLSSNVTGSEMLIFPVAEQQLAKDVTYKVVIEPNTVGDIAGNNGNERIEISYLGTYENEIPVVDGVVFSEDFDEMGVNNMMLYDGDQRTPVSEMADWGFQSAYPWWQVRDNEESTDQSAVSHSMYSPVGKSDDWMVTRRMYIPDETCSLTFDSQSYKKYKEDYLKVYVLATDDVYTAPITKSFIDRIKSEGEMVYNERQTPGASEDLLAGDWTHSTVKLDKYARKNIYIAFVNDNENQSAVFVDNILVQRDMAFTVGVDVPSFVVDAASVPVKVMFSVKGDDTYDDVTLRLVDADDKVVDEKSFTGLGLKKGDSFSHTFEKELPLAKGRVNEYSVEAVASDKTVSMPMSVKNLRFRPERTVVIEEGTGTKCGYCPLGHRTLEMIDEIYGEKVVPVAVHSYTTGSEFLTSWTAAYGQFLGFQTYPTGLINREYAASPMDNENNVYSITSASGDKTWCDYLSKVMGELTDAEIHIDHATIDPEKGMIEVGVDMRYAYDSDNVNLNVHTVVLENGLTARQENNVSSVKSDILGDWGSGGKYGRPSVVVPFNHVARGMHGTSYAGVSGMFPRVIDSSLTYDKVYGFEIPRDLTDVNNAEVVVMLIDANSQRVINAAKAPCLVGVVGVDEVLDGAARDTGAVYSVTGVRVLENATIEDVNRLEKGIYIFNGKKVMVR